MVHLVQWVNKALRVRRGLVVPPVMPVIKVTWDHMVPVVHLACRVLLVPEERLEAGDP